MGYNSDLQLTQAFLTQYPLLRILFSGLFRAIEYEGLPLCTCSGRSCSPLVAASNSANFFLTLRGLRVNTLVGLYLQKALLSPILLVASFLM